MSESRTNIAEEIKSLLVPIGLPVAQTSYKGTADTYIIFNFTTINSSLVKSCYTTKHTMVV